MSESSNDAWICAVYRLAPLDGRWRRGCSLALAWLPNAASGPTVTPRPPIRSTSSDDVGDPRRGRGIGSAESDATSAAGSSG